MEIVLICDERVLEIVMALPPLQIVHIIAYI